MSFPALLNPSKACLSMSAVLAGYCLLRFYAYTAGNPLVVPYLIAAGAFLGMADSAWRLIFTAAAEHAEGRETTPTGTIGPTAAFMTAVFTSIAGVMCAMTGGYNSFRIGGLIVVITLARAALFRNVEIISPILRGAIWGLFFILGMTAHPSFAEMLYIGETRIPAAFFTFYLIAAAVLSQVKDSSKPREAPPEDELASVTASRLLEMRDDTIDSLVAWFAGSALVVIPIALAWIMPWRWVSWALLMYLAMITATRLIPVVVYRTRKDLVRFIEGVFRGSAVLNAGAVASLGDYRMREIYEGWMVPVPGRDELIAIAAILAIAAPAWLFRRTAPVD